MAEITVEEQELIERRLDPLWPEIEGRLDAGVLELIDEHAATSDESGRIAEPVLDALRTSGYFGLPVPTDLQGGGLDMAQCCALQRRIAQLDPALALALNMHVFSVGVMVEHWRHRADTSWLLLEAVATQGRIVASGFAEPGLAGSTLRSNCVAKTTDGGYSISGVKVPCSLVAQSDLVCFQAQEDGPDGDLFVCLVPTAAPGMNVVRNWNWIGMRASESDTLRLENCEIPDDLVFQRTRPGHDTDEIFAAGTIWFCVVTAAAYLGLLERAVAFTVEAMSRQVVTHTGQDRTSIPVYRAQLGTAVADLLDLTTSLLGIAHLVEGRAAPATAVLPHALALKRRAAEFSVRSTAALTELAGAGSLSRGKLLERLVRDTQGGRFHPPTPTVTAEILGRWVRTGEVLLEVSGEASRVEVGGVR